jgi:hypothetical protein
MATSVRTVSRVKRRASRSQHIKTKISSSKPKKVIKRKVRSQYVMKKQKYVKRTGVKNYLSGVISNVSDSVKNTGKAVLSPMTKRVKKTRKVSKA